MLIHSQYVCTDGNAFNSKSAVGGTPGMAARAMESLLRSDDFRGSVTSQSESNQNGESNGIGNVCALHVIGRVHRGRGISWRSTSDLAPNWRNPEPFESCIQDGAGKRSFLRRGRWPCGAVVSGRRTYDVSDAWGGNGPMGPLPLFVVTHQPPDSIPQGPLPYTFVTGGIESAIEQAQRAAAGKDVVLMGATMVQQSLRAGLLDEIIINLVPITLGDGVRLLEGVGPGQSEFAIDSVISAPEVTHLTYRVVR